MSILANFLPPSKKRTKPLSMHNFFHSSGSNSNSLKVIGLANFLAFKNIPFGDYKTIITTPKAMEFYAKNTPIDQLQSMFVSAGFESPDSINSASNVATANLPFGASVPIANDSESVL